MIKVPFELTLSGAAASVSLASCMGGLYEGGAAGPLTGTFETAEDDIRNIFIKVRWAEGQASGHRFAKLRLELPGKPTLEKVFDAPGDIDDIWQLDP